MFPVNMQFEAKICLLTSFRDTCFIEIMPRNQAPKRGKTRKIPLWLLIILFCLKLHHMKTLCVYAMYLRFPNFLATTLPAISPNKSCLSNSVIAIFFF